MAEVISSSDSFGSKTKKQKQKMSPQVGKNKEGKALDHSIGDRARQIRKRKEMMEEFLKES